MMIIYLKRKPLRSKTKIKALNKAVGGIGAFLNALGIRPLGSYENERTRGPRGTNIGTSGLANYIAGGGPLGALFGGNLTPSKER